MAQKKKLASPVHIAEGRKERIASNFLTPL